MLEKLLQATMLEHAINAALNLDPQATEKLAVINGRRVSVQLENMPQTWLFSIDDARLSLLQESEAAAEADVRLRGNLGGFLQLFRGADKVADKQNKLYIEGDVYAAQQFQRVMAELAPDFDAVLRARLGDGLGGAAASALQMLRSQGERAKEKAESWLQEFVQGEAGFVSQTEFALQTAELERLQSRLRALETRLSQWESR